MTILKACGVCGRLSEEPRCERHRRRPWANSDRRQRTVSGWEQQRRAKRVLERDYGICHVCREWGADAVDHVTPLSQGGKDDESNLAPIHSEPCHRLKTAREAERGRGRRQEVPK
jgi:5-methylcytosine-specific restriction protein A